MQGHDRVHLNAGVQEKRQERDFGENKSEHEITDGENMFTPVQKALINRDIKNKITKNKMARYAK